MLSATKAFNDDNDFIYASTTTDFFSVCSVTN